jgi:DNA-binding MarR family transcriptional regulator
MPKSDPDLIELTTSQGLGFIEVAELTRLRMVLGRVGRILRQQADDGLPYPQISLLFNILRNEPITPTHLAAAEGVTAPSVTRSLDTLQRAGFVTREASKTDGRMSVIRLTTAGREECTRLLHSRDVWLSEHLLRMTPQELRELVRLIPVLEKLCDPELPRVGPSA